MAYNKATDFNDIQKDVLFTNITENKKISKLKKFKTAIQNVQGAINELSSSSNKANISANEADLKVTEIQKKVEESMIKRIVAIWPKLSGQKQSMEIPVTFKGTVIQAVMNVSTSCANRDDADAEISADIQLLNSERSWNTAGTASLVQGKFNDVIDLSGQDIKIDNEPVKISIMSKPARGDTYDLSIVLVMAVDVDAEGE